MSRAMSSSSSPRARARLAIVVSEFNGHVTGRMLEHALRMARELGAEVREVARAPGAFDMPLLVDRLLKKDEIDALVCLGAIIKGETAHDEVIAFSLAKTLQELALRHGKPIGFGVSGPRMNEQQALARAEEYAERAVRAALRLLEELRGVA